MTIDLVKQVLRELGGHHSEVDAFLHYGKGQWTWGPTSMEQGSVRVETSTGSRWIEPTEITSISQGCRDGTMAAEANARADFEQQLHGRASSAPEASNKYPARGWIEGSVPSGAWSPCRVRSGSADLGRPRVQFQSRVLVPANLTQPSILGL
jgi:hypothetical protein